MEQLHWTVLADTGLSAPLLERLRGLWDPSAPVAAPRRSLADDVEHRVAVLASDEASGGRTVGVALAGCSPTERFGIVDYVFVAPDRRHANLGRMLVDRAVDEIRGHADVLFADAQQISEDFLRSMGWRLAPRGGAHAWVPESGRLRIYPRTPGDAIEHLAVRVLDRSRVATSVMLTTVPGSRSWSRPVLDAIMRGDLAQRDLDEATSRAVDDLLSAK